MMNEAARKPIVVTHRGGMRFATQIRSHQIFTDQPVSAGGKDSAPSPIELLGAALGNCIAFYVQQFCETRDLPYDGMRVEIEQRSEKSPARVAEFIGRVIMPEELPEEYAGMLDRVVTSCPAHNTLARGALVNIEVLVPAAP